MALPTKPGNSLRGWNDPPMLLHDSSNPKSQSNRPTASVENSAGGVMLLPPANTAEPRPAFVAPLIVPGLGESGVSNGGGVPSNSEVIDISLPSFETDEQLYHFVTTRLWKAVTDCQAVISEKESKDIAGKINTLQIMWQGGRISYPVKASMARLVTALHRRLCDMAHDIHVCLLMDYASEVGSWMIGVKRLINACRSVDAPLSPTDTTQSSPASSSSLQDGTPIVPGSLGNHQQASLTSAKDASAAGDAFSTTSAALAVSSSTSSEAVPVGVSPSDDIPSYDQSAGTPHATPDDVEVEEESNHLNDSCASGRGDLTLSQVADKLQGLVLAAATLSCDDTTASSDSDSTVLVTASDTGRSAAVPSVDNSVAQ